MTKKHTAEVGLMFMLGVGSGWVGHQGPRAAPDQECCGLLHHMLSTLISFREKTIMSLMVWLPCQNEGVLTS